MSQPEPEPEAIVVDVLIAGSGPIGCTYARTILDHAPLDHPSRKVLMVEVGSQDHPVRGAHFKNSVKYQKDIDAFVNVIKGALQPVSIPPEETFQSTLGGSAWHPHEVEGKILTFYGRNPNQIASENLRATAITRTVGGMATHWTCCCPRPDEDEERKEGQKFVPKDEFDKLFKRAGDLLAVNEHEFDNSIRHTAVKKALENLPGEARLGNLPLGVKRRTDNPDFVTWTGSDTILGTTDSRFSLKTEARFTKFVEDPIDSNLVGGALLYDLNTGKDIFVKAQAYVLACGAICTPQILYNSKIPTSQNPRIWPNICPPSVGRYLSEQSMAFCQIVLSRDIINSISSTDPKVVAHQERHPFDPLPIPFNDPEPQVYLKYTPAHPWHVQVHRDAFSYGDVGPKADPRVVVDLRFFGKSEIVSENRVAFGERFLSSNWVSGILDTYGMPQPTFHVNRTLEDRERDQRMMNDMCQVANMLGGYLPGSYPQFLEPGLALHITGTTRMGDDPHESVVDSESRMHGFKNLWLGGNNVIPDSTACNPTRTSIAYAIKGAEALNNYLDGCV